jgi:hypothetical protein
MMNHIIDKGSGQICINCGLDTSILSLRRNYPIFCIPLDPIPSTEEIEAFNKFSDKRSTAFKAAFPWANNLFLYTEMMRVSKTLPLFSFMSKNE